MISLYFLAKDESSQSDFSDFLMKTTSVTQMC